MKNKKKILFGAASVLIIVLVSLGFKSLGFFKDQQQNLSTKLYHGRELSDEIVIVAIDPKSLSTPEGGGLNRISLWTRQYYGDALDRIEAGSPSAVFYDVLFSSESNGLKSEELVSVAQESSDATSFAEKVMGYAQSPHPYDIYFANILDKYENVYLLKNTAGELSWEGSAFRTEDEETPLTLLAEKANLAFSSVIDTSEGENSNIIFAIPTKFSLGGETEEHVDLQLVREHLGADADLDIPTEQGQMLINYAAPSYSYPMVSFADVYYGQVDPSVFEGKIVLIGATAAILQDRHFTPIDQNQPMPGIEIHANAIQTILDGEYLQYQSTGSFLMELAVVLLASVAVFLYAPVLMGSLLLVLELVAFPFIAQWSFNRGVIIDLIWPVFALGVAYLAALVYRNFTEFAEKRKLKTAFSRYVSKDLAEQITEKPELLQLGGERRNITALFLDIENFTTLSEGLEPQEVVGIINTYFDALSKVIMEHQGSVDKYEGDAIMALFGAPLPSTDHAMKACQAALAIQAKILEVNAATGHNLNIRVGLASGDAIVGNMGSAERFDYTAMGDTVNTASRLEGANKFYKTRILVNPGTREAAGGGIFFRQVDTVCLKGKDKSIAIYEVMGALEGASEAGKALVEEWHGALEAYRVGNWELAETGMKAVLEKLPDDGPALTLLARMAELKMLYRQGETGLRPGWDGVWRFDVK